MNDSKKDNAGQPTGLSELLALGLKTNEAWTAGELEAALQEQVSTPMEFDLSSFKLADAKSLRARAAAHGLLLKNLRELFLHPKPPLELLVMAKDYFKANTVRPQPGMPEDVARALYCISMAVAWLRHHQLISKLSNNEVVEALKWVVRQTWIGDDLRVLADTAAEDLRVVVTE